MSKLLDIIREIRRQASTDLANLTVLSPMADPYRQCADVEARWFTDQLERFAAHGRIHLRGLHYRVVAAADVLRPDGTPYINNDECWTWLCRSGKAARWLGLVDFGRIRDARNDPPVDYVPAVERIKWELSAQHFACVPDLDDVIPQFTSAYVDARQPYRLVLMGEKASLADEVLPIAKRVGGEMLLPTGEPSDTMVAELAERATLDGRHTVVFYLSDFDPAGRQMPVSVARKLQAIRDLRYPDLQIDLHHVAVTRDQVERFDLPSTPLKPTERRADKWREIMGREQTEIDALLALHPGALGQIVTEAVAPFYDASLQDRTDNMRRGWIEDANAYLQEHPEYALRRRAVEDALDDYRLALHRISSAQDAIVRLNGEFDTGVLDQPAPKTHAGSPVPLFSTRDAYPMATEKLRLYRAMDGEGGRHE